MASGLPATLPMLLPLTSLSLLLPPPDAFGLRLGVRGLRTGGHASVTQARDTVDLGVVTYYHSGFAGVV